MIPRPYQTEAINAMLASLGEYGRSLMVLPTGMGKTIVAAHIANHLANHGRVLFLVHREELVYQAADKLRQVTGDAPDIEMGERRASTLYPARFVVGTIQTQGSGRGEGRKGNFKPEDFSLVIVDECHRICAKSYRKTIDYYSRNDSVRVMGMTATPDRNDQQALGQVFSDVGFSMGIEKSIDDAWLVPIRQAVVRVTGYDLSAIHTVAGDLNQGELEEVVMRERVLHGVANHTIEHTAGKKTLVFAASIDHARALSDILNRAEPGSAYSIDSKMTYDKRRLLVAGFRRGDFRTLVNVGICTEGFDVPDIEIVVIARPTKSRSLYCLDEHTEVLTPSGWKGPNDIIDVAFEYRPESQSIHRSLVLSRIDRPMLDGERMFGISGRHLDIAVSDKHRMLVNVRNGRARIRKDVVVDAGSMPPDIPRMYVCGDEHASGVPLTDDEIRFIGLVMTDGNISKSTNAVTLYQSDRHPECVAYMESVLVGCGFKFNRLKPDTSPTNYGPRNFALNKWTVSRGKPRGRDKHLRGWQAVGDYLDKDMSPLLEQMTRRQLLVLLEAMNVGDGAKFKCASITWTPRTMAICTGRKVLADRIQSLCVRRGIRCNIATPIKEGAVLVMHIDPTRRTISVPTSAKDRTSWGPRQNVGRLWCIEVPSGFIVCRRNGKPFIAGNCQMIGRGTRPLAGLVDAHHDDLDARCAAIASSAKPHLTVLDFAGNAGRHRLVSVASILGGRYDNAVIDRVMKKAERAGDSIDVRKALEEAARLRQEQEDNARQREIQRLRKLRIGSQASVTYVDPFRPADMPQQESDIQRQRAKAELATEKQRAYLEGQGVRLDYETLGKREASKVIDRLIKRRERGLCSPKQFYRLMGWGWSKEAAESTPFVRASEIIGDVAAHGWSASYARRLAEQYGSSVGQRIAAEPAR